MEAVRERVVALVGSLECEVELCLLFLVFLHFPLPIYIKIPTEDRSAILL